MNIFSINIYSQSLKEELIEHREKKKIHFSFKCQRNNMMRGNVVESIGNRPGYESHNWVWHSASGIHQNYIGSGRFLPYVFDLGIFDYYF